MSPTQTMPGRQPAGPPPGLAERFEDDLILEVDIPVWRQEQAMSLRGPARGLQLVPGVRFMYDGFEIFIPVSINEEGILESGQIRLKRSLAQHAIETTKVFPPAVDDQGNVLNYRDHKLGVQIPQLRIVGVATAQGVKAPRQGAYVSPFDTSLTFDRQEDLQKHLDEVWERHERKVGKKVKTLAGIAETVDEIQSRKAALEVLERDKKREEEQKAQAQEQEDPEKQTKRKAKSNASTE